MKVALTEMSDLDYKAFQHISVPSYAIEKVRNFDWPEEGALERSQETYENLLPDGLQTKDHFVRNIMNGEQKAGFVWFAVQENHLYIYDIRVFDHLQNQGIGKEVMNLLNEEGKLLGVENIKLHVFGFNKRAFKFYERVGFEITSYTMNQVIDDSETPQLS